MNIPACEIYWLGRVDYDSAWDLQNILAAQIAVGKRPPTLLLLEHPHVYTIGRKGSTTNLLWDERTCQQRGITLRHVDRGGDITYHGPGQLVGYPILPLAHPGWQGERLPQADFVGYLRKLEEVLIRLLESYSIPSYRREGLTGVWCRVSRLQRTPPITFPEPRPAKIASIGVKVDRSGISRHGFAINVHPDMDYWQGLIPCGLNDVLMIAMSDVLPETPSIQAVALRTARYFSQVFGVDSPVLLDGRVAFNL
jgi:lipoyl(octanoyl) transferase